jgi:hypothetical protein
VGAPFATRTTSGPVGQDDVAESAETSITIDDPLAGFGQILAAMAQRDRESEALTAARLETGRRFLDEFATACSTEVGPAMKAVLERLRELGGDGLITEHPGGEARFLNPRLTLWMSLRGTITGEPRLDRYPYLQFEADVERRKVQVDEGDMWRGAGGHTSGRAGSWDIADLTRGRVTDELLAIARRAAA